MAWKFPRLAWVLPRIKPWGPLGTDPRETAEGHKLGCFLSVAGVMLGGGGGRKLSLSLEKKIILNSHGSTKHNLNKHTLGFKCSSSRNSLSCLEGSEPQSA